VRMQEWTEPEQGEVASVAEVVAEAEFAVDVAVEATEWQSLVCVLCVMPEHNISSRPQMRPQL
jgi:hypothetical protein